jgi:hypothetical protein
MKKLSVLLVLIIFFLTTCKKENSTPHDDKYIVFGHFYGNCEGEGCIEIYKLEHNKFSEDIRDAHPSFKKFYEGNFVQQSHEKYNMVKGLLDSFPMEILSEMDTVLGEPDAGDWGGLYIEYYKSGSRRFWLLDKNKDYAPKKYHHIIDLLDNKIKMVIK